MACRGVLFALTEEQAQRFLDAHGDEEVRDLVEEVEEAWEVNYLQETDKAWDAIHRCLSDGTPDVEARSCPLNRCILGGKHLYDGDDYVVAFVAPAEVGDVAVGLKDITEAWFRECFFALTGTDFPDMAVLRSDLATPALRLREAAMILQEAAKYGAGTVVERIVAADPEQVNLQDRDGQSALQAAIFGSHLGIAVFLLSHGADVHSRDHRGWTALQEATYNSTAAMVNLLLASGAQVDTRDNRGRTPLHYAAADGYADIVDLLLQHGADCDVADFAGLRPVQLAQREEKADVIALLELAGCF